MNCLIRVHLYYESAFASLAPYCVLGFVTGTSMCHFSAHPCATSICGPKKTNPAHGRVRKDFCGNNADYLDRERMWEAWGPLGPS